MKRKLIKFSNYSFCITLPKKAVEQLGWTKGEEVDVVFDSKKKRIVVNKSTASDKPGKSTPKAIENKPSTDSEGEIQPIPKLRW